MGFVNVPQAAQPFTLATRFTNAAADRWVHPNAGASFSAGGASVVSKWRAPSPMTLKRFDCRNGLALGVADQVDLDVLVNGAAVLASLEYVALTGPITHKSAAGAVTLATGDTVEVKLTNVAGAYVDAFVWEISLEPIV